MRYNGSQFLKYSFVVPVSLMLIASNEPKEIPNCKFDCPYAPKRSLETLLYPKNRCHPGLTLIPPILKRSWVYNSVSSRPRRLRNVQSWKSRPRQRLREMNPRLEGCLIHVWVFWTMGKSAVPAGRQITGVPDISGIFG